VTDTAKASRKTPIEKATDRLIGEEYSHAFIAGRDVAALAIAALSTPA
jgi:hypothetical protein